MLLAEYLSILTGVQHQHWPLLCCAAGPAKNGHNKDKNGLFVQFSVCANLKKETSSREIYRKKGLLILFYTAYTMHSVIRFIYNNVHNLMSLSTVVDFLSFMASEQF